MMSDIKEGILLISDPFLQDPNFMRTVVLVCEHNSEGSVGFVLNRQYDANVGMVLETLSFCDYPLFYGGPVQPDTLHFVHCRPDIVSDSVDIGNGIFWGGNLETVAGHLKAGELSREDILFLLDTVDGAKLSSIWRPIPKAGFCAPRAATLFFARKPTPFGELL